ncbi:MAG: signal peptidase I [Neisseriaceae bacterium]|nr:signal peptidase I [Neisseriaceae bacterium]
MSNTLFYICIALFVGGLGLSFTADKKRNAETNEWSANIQWGLLAVIVGLFGVLAKFMSFTAVLLIFTVGTLIFWIMNKINKKHHKENAFTDYLGSFFPIVLIVFLLRTFIAEPFVIPSSSMRPGLVPGDFVLVKKFSYGVRTPIINNVLIPTGKIEQGDVVVFNYPPNPDINYIKRIVAVGGDTVEYRNKILKINGKIANDTAIGSNSFPQDGTPFPIPVEQFKETLNGKDFDIFQIVEAPTYSPSGVEHNDPACQYDETGFICQVPQGKYFAMGDNRDNSADSRYWGFVDDKYIVGKAWIIWFNWGELKRIGTSIK